jgi:hypothetical protein
MFSAFHSEPGDTECWEAVWSEGRACKSCWFDCYRAGWTKSRVDTDNARLVKEKLASIARSAD